MDKIKEMGEGIVVEDAPVHRTTVDGVMAKGKRGATTGNTMHVYVMRLVCDAVELTRSRCEQKNDTIVRQV